MNLEKIPEHLVILGGGFIGMEFANMFANFGTKITILNSSEIPLLREDADIREQILKIFASQNVEFINSARASKIEKNGEKLEIFYGENSILADAVLVATGRASTARDLDVQNAGVVLDEKGFIRVNDRLETSAKNIFALGDVNDGPQFTYISLDDYRIIRDTIFGGEYTRAMRKPIATSVFMKVPYSHIGLKEYEIDKQNPGIRIKTLPTAMIPKSKILGENDGLLKAIVNVKTGEILGCTLLCLESYEMINLVKMAMDNNLPYSTLKNQIFTHPTMSESLNDLFSF